MEKVMVVYVGTSDEVELVHQGARVVLTAQRGVPLAVPHEVAYGMEGYGGVLDQPDVWKLHTEAVREQDAAAPDPDGAESKSSKQRATRPA